MSLHLEDYAEAYSTPEDDYLHRLYRATHTHLLYPRMASGHMQGLLLRMLCRMLRPRDVLEIGTFSGYSALAMASGMEAGSRIVTYEINDEQEVFTRPWIEGSPYPAAIEMRIGNVLELLPQTDETFDLAYIDGNKRDYIRRMVNFKLTHGTEEQMDALRSGFYAIVPPAAVQGFSAEEFEQLLVGSSDVDVDDWQRHTHYLPSSAAQHAIFSWFWEIVRAMGNDDRLLVLHFATGSSTVPLGGFVNLMANGRLKSFTLCLTAEDPGSLPVAHTCFNQIDLPAYPSKAVLETKLRTAITETGGILLV